MISLRCHDFVRSFSCSSFVTRCYILLLCTLGGFRLPLGAFFFLFCRRESLDQVRDLGFHVMVTANAEGLLWTQHGAGLAATLGSEVVAVDRMDDDEVCTHQVVYAVLHSCQILIPSRKDLSILHEVT